MPEYQDPGAHVEDGSYRSKSIEGVSTTTTGFVGPTRYGSTDLPPDVITSLGEFELAYGDHQKLVFGSSSVDNYMWHAARAFFQEGGKRLYVSRIFRPWGEQEEPGKDANNVPLHRDGIATGKVDDAGVVSVRARFPGAAGNLRVRFTVRVGQNVLAQDTGPDGRPQTVARGLRERDLVRISDIKSQLPSPLEGGTFALATYDGNAQSWSFRLPDGSSIPISELNPGPETGVTGSVRPVTLTITVLPQDCTTAPQVFEGLALDPAHLRDGAPDSVSARFHSKPASMADARTLPIVVKFDSAADGLQALNAILDAKDDLRAQVLSASSTDIQGSLEVPLVGGNDGHRPASDEYKGKEYVEEMKKTGLVAFENIDDISIVAAPGSTEGYEDENLHSEAASVVNLLIAHAQEMRYRIAVLDSGRGQSLSQVRAMRAILDSSYAALYYPWIKVLDPVTRQEIPLPPSAFVAGIYARNDTQRAVYNAPADEVVNLAIGLEQLLTKNQQDVLNPEGINCFRYFEGRGCRLWGARTVSSDPEWKYVNLRRYFIYLEHSVDKGTQWVVFEPNGEALWANVRRTVEEFLLNEWRMGALIGDKPEKAFFVRCDRSTMTQSDLDNGRLVCLIGVAPLRPAEFVIFRIGQWTADRKS